MTKSLIDVLLDPEDGSDLTFYDEEGKAVEMAQVAVIPYDGDVYAILAPKELLADDDPNVAMVYKVDGDNIKLVEDDETADTVFDLYDALYEEQTKKKK